MLADDAALEKFHVCQYAKAHSKEVGKNHIAHKLKQKITAI